MTPPAQKRVFRYTVPIDDSTHELPQGRVVHVDTRDVTKVEVWVEVSGDGAGESRTVQVFGTGHVIPLDAEHIGSVLSPAGERYERGALVWHLYAVPPASVDLSFPDHWKARMPELDTGGTTS